MDSPPQAPSGFSNSGATKVKAATVWLYLVAAATLVNSLLLLKYFRFVDLWIGLSFTQFIDAASLGSGVEPAGSPSWWVDAFPALAVDVLFASVLVVLAAKVSHRKRRATQVSFWIYTIDTAVFALSFGADLAVFHAPISVLVWQLVTLLAHTGGVLILFQAWRVVVNEAQVLH